MVAVALPRGDAEALRRVLYERHRIEVAVTSHGERNFLRVAFQGYNTRSDADALVSAVREGLELAH